MHLSNARVLTREINNCSSSTQEGGDTSERLGTCGVFAGVGARSDIGEKEKGGKQHERTLCNGDQHKNKLN